MSEKIITMRKIADWLEYYGWKIYYDQKNRDGYDVFHSSPSNKPDLLLTKNGYNILVEVKPGQKHNDILDGVQDTLEYAGEYWSGRSIYYLEDRNKPLKIDAFVLATDFSLDGYLYGKESNVGCIGYTGYLARNKNMNEKPSTHSLVRWMWRSWDKSFCRNYYRTIRRGRANDDVKLPDKPKVGALISKINNENRQSSDEPYLYLNSNIFVPLYVGEIYAFE